MCNNRTLPTVTMESDINEDESNAMEGEYENANENANDSSINENEHDDDSENENENEYFHLSGEARNRIQEEVHGVHCMNPEENPELLRESLSKLAEILDSNDHIPERDKKAYLASQRLGESIPTYVNTDDFRLRFLRADLFDIHKAARSIVKFLDMVEATFGPYALERPPQLDDFDKDELKMIRKGLIQFLPYRDRSGRRVMILFPNDTLLNECGNALRCKIILYFLYSAGTNDLDSQRKGIVAIIWAQDSNFILPNFSFKDHSALGMTKLHECRPLRASAIHFCTPDTIIYRLMRKIAVASAGDEPPNPHQGRTGDYEESKIRQSIEKGLRYRVHLGEPIELQYALQSYGVPIGKIPITLSNTIKLAYFNQFLWIRQYIEQGLSIVECPGLYDIVIRQGTAAMYHPGNTWFLNLIQRKFEAHLLHILQRRGQQGGLCKDNYHIFIDHFKLTPSLLNSFVSELMEAIRETSGRILTWYDNKGYGCVGWWTVLDCPEQIKAKVEYMVSREFKKLISSITKELKRHKRKEDAASLTTRRRSTSNGDSSPLPQAPTQVLDSATSIFQSQDGSTGLNNGGGCGTNPIAMDCDGSEIGSVVGDKFFGK